eukprot:4191589-Amphidinium_carterae.1
MATSLAVVEFALVCLATVSFNLLGQPRSSQVEVHCADEQNLATADYDPNKLKILRGETRPKPVESLLEGEVKKWITNPDKFIVKSPEDIAAGPEPVRPHWAPEMRTDGAVRRDF